MIQSVQKPLPWWQQSAPPPMPGTEEDPTQPPAPPPQRFDMPDEPQQAQQGFMPEMPQWQPQAMASAAPQGMPDEPGTAPAPAPVAPPVQQEPDPNAMGRDPVRRARMIGALEGADEARAQKPATGIGQGIAQQARDRAVQKYITDHEKKSSGWDIARQAIGAAMQISPRLSGVGHVLMHPPNKTEESIPVLESAAKQEELQQQAISGEAVKRSQIAANEAWHDASIAEKEAALKKPPTVAELAAMKHPDGTPVFSKDQIAIIASGGHLQQKSEPMAMQMANLASQDSIERDAEKLVRYGVAPSGVGRGGTGYIIKVQNRAAEMAKERGVGVSDTQLWAAQQKTDQADLTHLQTQRDQALSSEGLAKRNLDIALQNSEAVDRTGSPLINRLVLWAKGELMGDDDTSLFENSIETAASEYAKVITGTVGPATDALRAATGAMLRKSLAKGTFAKDVAQMKLEMSNRKAGYDDQLDEIRTRMGSSLNDKKPKPGEAPAPTAPPPVAKGTVNLQAPDGTVKPVPADQVEHYLKLGAKRVP